MSMQALLSDVVAERRRVETLLAPSPPAPSLEAFAADFLVTDGGAPLRPQSALHRYLCRELPALPRNARLSVMAPRGSAKSSWATFAYPLHAAVHALEPYIVLTSDTGAQACKYLDALRAELVGNDLLREHYPDACGAGPTWREERIVLRNGVCIEAAGTGSKLRGRKHRQHRPSLIVVDDPQNVEHIISPLQRERSWDWLVKDVCNAGSPRTNIVVLGTALHRECIVCRLPRTPGWRCETFRSITTWPQRMDLWGQWEERLHDWENPEREATARAFYEANREAMES